MPPSALLLLDENNSITGGNLTAANLLGFPSLRDMSSQASFLDLIAPEDHAWFQEAIQTMQEQGFALGKAIPFLRSDGTHIPIDVELSQLLNPQGHPIGVSITLRETKDATEENEAIRKAAHAFNNMLGGLLGTLELAKLAAHEPQKVLEKLRDAQNAVRRAQWLTKRLRKHETKQSITPNLRILVLEDDEVLVQVLDGMLTQLGHRVTPVRSGEEAIAAYRRAMVEEDEFGAVFFDLTLETGMGGKETFEKIRELDPNLKAIALSGDCQDPLVLHPKHHGFVRSVTKPFTFDDLTDALKAVMSSG